MIALALAISTSMIAQTSKTEQNQDQKSVRIKEPKMAQENVKLDQHGTSVSTVAKETISEPGKGEVVSTQAKTQGEAKRTEKQIKKEQKELRKDKTIPNKQIKGSARGNRNPAIKGRPISKGGAKQVPR